MKRVEYDYNLSSTYTDRRIIGLPAEVRTYGWSDGTSSEQYTSRITYAYDEGGYGGTGQSLSNAAQHCTSTSAECPTAYGTAFQYRGNLTSTRRWDVTTPTTESASILSSVAYNIAGSPISQTTPWDGTNTRTVTISYADVWNDSVTRYTYAYPTTITDPASNSSTVKYRYDIGANVEATSPAPAGQTYGKTTKRIFDSLGRLERNSIYVNTIEHSYVRYEFPTNGIQSKVYATLIDVDGDTNIAEDEVLSESWTDGAGRVRLARKPHTFSGGSTATWAGVQTEYDILGRVKRQSVPTEVDSSWAADGDDETSGFRWTYQKYDWMGRVVRKINTDGDPEETANDSDIFISYEGCGCAGGLVTTIEGELVPRTDTSGNARRRQKVYADILGRTWKAETYEWNGTTVYSTVVPTFNGRDQVTQSRQYAGTTSSSTYQDTTATFDGHGRLATSHKPEQMDEEEDPLSSVYNYNPDGSVLSVTDARGAVTNYTYNSRGLATNIGWTVPGGSGIPDPTDVTFSYDNIGNRTAMTDGLGSVAYAYNSLSQMTSETRTFSDTLADKPTGNFNIGYEYTVGGQLKSYTDPYGEEIEYAHDKAGRLDTVTGTSFAGVTSYANNPEYRAWGALKHLEYGSGRQMEVGYSNRLQPESSEINEISTPTTKTFNKEYEYYTDGRLKLVDETHNSNWDKYDRSFTYDHQGRIYNAKSGIEAHGGNETDETKLPYRQSYSFNAFGNITGRDSTLWNYVEDWWFSYTVVNNRISGTTYDHDGRQTIDQDSANFAYDAPGQMVSTSRSNSYETLFARDGTGAEIKRTHRSYIGSGNWSAWDTSYFINSSVLGQIVTEAKSTGKKKTTYVIAAGSIVAKQTLNSSDQEGVAWQYRDASGLSSRSSGVGSWTAFVAEELDGLRNNVGTHANITPQDRSGTSGSPNDRITFDGFTGGDCELDGILTPCSMVQRMGESLRVQARWWNSREGFYSTYHDFNRDLPGRSLSFSIWIQDPTRSETNVHIGNDGDPLPATPSPFTPTGQWFTFHLPSLGVSTPCAKMASRAQELADKYIREAGTDILFGRGRDRAWDSILGKFDDEFTTMYIGRAIKDTWPAIRVWWDSGGIKSPPMDQYGQQDFLEKFLDSEFKRLDTDLMADQVHHFAAFLSMGINNVNVAALIHTGQDAVNFNRGDVALSNASHLLGRDLRLQPRKLNNIGNLIQRGFCLPMAKAAIGGQVR